MRKRTRNLLAVLMVAAMAAGILAAMGGVGSAESWTGTELNVADKTQMNVSDASFVSFKHNGFSMAPAAPSQWYSSSKKHDEYRASFYISVPSEIADLPYEQTEVRVYGKVNTFEDNQTRGYMFRLNNAGIYLMKGVPGKRFIYQSNAACTDFFDSAFHHMEFQTFNEGAEKQNVRIRLKVDGETLIDFLDDGTMTKEPITDEEIPNEYRAPITEAGYFGIQTAAREVQYAADLNYNNQGENFASGMPASYDASSTAVLSSKKVVFSEEAARETVTAERFADFSSEFSLELSEGGAFKASFADGAYSADFTTTGFSLNKQGEEQSKCTVDLSKKFFVGVAAYSLRGAAVLAAYVETETGTASLLLVENGGKVDEAQVKYIGTKATLTTERERIRKPLRVMFIGNSITRHGVNESLGWSFDHGMAVMFEEDDYVHLVMSHIQQREGFEDAEYMIPGGGFETNYYQTNFAEEYRAARDYQADIIVFRTGENAGTIPESILKSYSFGNYSEKFLDFLNPNGTAKIIMTSMFLGDTSPLRSDRLDDEIERVAEKNGYDYIRLSDLSKDPENIVGTSEFDREYYQTLSDEGKKSPLGTDPITEYDRWLEKGFINWHPGMRGMQKISERLIPSIDAYLDETGAGAEFTSRFVSSGGLKAEGINGEGAFSFEAESFAADSAAFAAVSAKPVQDAALYRLFKFQHEGKLFNVDVPLVQDVDADLPTKLFLLSGLDAEPVAIPLQDVYHHFENTNVPRLTLNGSALSDGYLAVYLDTSGLYGGSGSTAELTEAKFVSVLEILSRDSDTLVIDPARAGRTGVTQIRVNKSFEGIASQRKDVELRFAGGAKIVVRADVFACMASSYCDLSFSIAEGTAAQKNNAAAALLSLGETYSTPRAVYSVQIRYYTSRTAFRTAYLTEGVEVFVPFSPESGEEDLLTGLTAVTASLPAIGSGFGGVYAEDERVLDYADGTVKLRLFDFGKEVILAYDLTLA